MYYISLHFTGKEEGIRARLIIFSTDVEDISLQLKRKENRGKWVLKLCKNKVKEEDPRRVIKARRGCCGQCGERRADEHHS